MKDKSAMQTLIYQLKLCEAVSVNSQTGAYSHCIKLAEGLLHSEKKQIVEAFDIGWGTPHGEKCTQEGNAYYSVKFE